MRHRTLIRIALSIVAFGWPVLARGDTPRQEYVDPQYHFAFQYPSDWTLDTRTQPGKGGEMRVAVRDAQSSARAVASVGQVGRTLTKAQLDAAPERERIVQGLIDMAIKEIYTRASEALHGKQMVVANKQVLPSDDGVMFHVSTLQTIGEDQIVIAGMHLIPFTQSHMISFIMMSPFKVAPAQQQAINAVLKSFRFVTPR
jgi:hypothetical protein